MPRLGAIPTIMPASRLADALAHGSVDAVMLSPGGLFQFGTAGSAANHYLLGIGAAPLVVVMNRKKFDSLPEAAQGAHPQVQRRAGGRDLDRTRSGSSRSGCSTSSNQTLNTRQLSPRRPT